MNEQRVVRWVDHIPVILAIGAAILTGVGGWVSMKSDVAALKDQVALQHARRDEVIARMVDKMNVDHDKITRLESDMSWLTRGKE